MTKRWRNEPDNYDDPMDIVYEYIAYKQVNDFSSSSEKLRRC